MIGEMDARGSAPCSLAEALGDDAQCSISRDNSVRVMGNEMATDEGQDGALQEGGIGSNRLRQLSALRMVVEGALGVCVEFDVLPLALPIVMCLFGERLLSSEREGKA